MYLARGLEERLQVGLRTAPLVIVEGARATGKTRLVNYALESGWLTSIRSFLDPVELNAARSAPRDYVFGLPHGTAVDEAQLCEAILLPVKERVEREKPGALLLTGSTRLRRNQLGGSDPLAGRVGAPLHLGPLTIGERSGNPTQLVGQLFDDDPASIAVGGLIARHNLIDLVQEPGLPGLLAEEPPVRNDRATAYIDQATTQSSFASLDIRRVGQLARYLAGRTSTTVNISQFASDVELARPTVEKYLAHLEEALVLIRLPGWRRSKDKSETDRAKIHFFDAGVACANARMRPGDQDNDLGRLTETLLVTDLVRQSRWLPEPPDCYHWRRSDRDEVDVIFESVDGRVICVEVKVSESVNGKDFRGIDAFRESHPAAFHRGFVFYSGRNVQPFGDDRWAIPFSALWSTYSVDVPTIDSVIAKVQSKRQAEKERRLRPEHREAAREQLDALGRGLTGYKATVRSIGTSVLELSVEPDLRSNPGSSEPQTLILVEVGGASIIASVGDSSLDEVHEEQIDERSPTAVVSALLAKASEDIGAELARLDVEYGL